MVPWTKVFVGYGLQRGYYRDQTLFIRKHKGEFLLVQVYVDDIIFGSPNPKLCREFEALMHDKFKMSAMGELSFFLGLQVLQKKDVTFLSQDKYVGDILKKFGFSDLRSANTPMDRENPLGKDRTGKDVDLHLYRSMIGSLMYLTTSRPDFMFVVCTCAIHQVTPKECHLHAIKRIFRYLKGHPKLGLLYPKESSFDLVAYSDSDYGGASQDRKSTTGGCQFLGRRLISWQCKKQTIVATSTTEAEYVAAASGCGQVLWIQNQLLDYGYNFMNTKIYIDNNSAICIVKNPVFHSRTKHIEIRHHFIRDCFEKKLIYVDHIHTDDNVADLLTKAFDVGRFQYLVVTGESFVNLARGCQFLGRRLIFWQCKKQTIVATSTTKAEYVAAASGCGQVLCIQNQLLDYGYNFMNIKIYIDNNSAICIVKNHAFHYRTEHIEIRHHFIRDCFKKKLIYVDHIHTDDNVADLLTKAFDVGRFQYLVVSIGMLDP
ncbi:putative ribonuclease H-like domain-containing protein [Tanacetum coccineum]